MPSSLPQHTQSLYGGHALADWIRQGGRPQRRIAAHAVRLWWQAHWFEHNWRTQAPRLSALVLPEDPVFIVGLWRSGTTALHELLAACTRWATPQTWQCFNPSTCFLTSAPAEHSVVERPMDQGRIASHGPQEDEFALLLLGEPSVYRGFVDPRRLRECGARQWQQEAAALPRWQDFVRGIAAQAPGKRLLLKSPNHTFRLPLLRALFPRARFIWIARHTGEVLLSNLKMWRAMMGVYALWGCPPGLLEGFLQDVVQAGSEAVARCLDDMPRESLLWVDFDELRTDPRRALECVLEFLGPHPSMDAAQLAHSVEQAVARIPIHPGSRTDLPADVSARKLENLMAAARQRFGPPPIAHRNVGL